MKLTDALSLLESTTGQTHKFWAYYQAFTAAAVALVWAADKPPPHMIYAMTLGYAVFAAVNCCLVVSSQRSALSVWNAIQAYVKTDEESVPDAFKSLTKLNKPGPPWRVGAMHMTLSVCACVAIYARLRAKLDGFA